MDPRETAYGFSKRHWRTMHATLPHVASPVLLDAGSGCVDLRRRRMWGDGGRGHSGPPARLVCGLDLAADTLVVGQRALRPRRSQARDVDGEGPNVFLIQGIPIGGHG